MSLMDRADAVALVEPCIITIIDEAQGTAYQSVTLGDCRRLLGERFCLLEHDPVRFVGPVRGTVYPWNLVDYLWCEDPTGKHRKVVPMARKRYQCHQYCRKNSDGTYTIQLLNLPGCISHGSDIDEATRNSQDAFESLIHSYLDDDLPIPWQNGYEVPKENDTDWVDWIEMEA